MMLKRRYLGLDIHPGGVAIAALNRIQKDTNLVNGVQLKIDPDLFTLSNREPNLTDGAAFVQLLQEELAPMAEREERLALSLPDKVGRFFLLEVEAAFKSKPEGVDILRWQLKNQLPVEPRDIHLDYQILEKREDGRYRLAVSVIATAILDQYEALINAAGFHAAVIDFHARQLYNFYRSRLNMGEDFILVAIEGGVLDLQFFQGNILCYQRTRQIDGDSRKVFQELSRSHIGGQEQHQIMNRCPVFVHTDPQQKEPLAGVAEAVFDREVILLNPHFDRLKVMSTGSTLCPDGCLLAAVGAAERMM